jgi:hypothetical protein
MTDSSTAKAMNSDSRVPAVISIMEKTKSASDGITYKNGFGRFHFLKRGASINITVAIIVKVYFNIWANPIDENKPRKITVKARPFPVSPRYAAVKNPIASGFIPKNDALAMINPIKCMSNALLLIPFILSAPPAFPLVAN